MQDKRRAPVDCPTDFGIPCKLQGLVHRLHTPRRAGWGNRKPLKSCSTLCLSTCPCLELVQCNTRSAHPSTHIGWQHLINKPNCCQMEAPHISPLPSNAKRHPQSNKDTSLARRALVGLFFLLTNIFPNFSELKWT